MITEILVGTTIFYLLMSKLLPPPSIPKEKIEVGRKYKQL